MLRLVAAFLASLGAAYLIGSVNATQFVLQEMLALGAAVSWGVRLDSTGRELVGLAGSYLPLLVSA
jgi:drug/metabolite transporter (DMT)-like permease